MRTKMVSALRTVARRWAMQREVRLCMRRSRASWTSCSLSVSRALVASSRRRILGLAKMARAMATRCFCPPESWTPLSPTNVL
mmetsp:Transcript_10625/g.18030  ORF Transcript_10625/g.18030 Transcript_10625/m.18030 type:complete len:83 (+) Transcript_10625:151-399(+)